MSSNNTQVIKDLKAKSILVAREFNAPVKDVWRAFTERELLDQWWGPAPWKAVTKSMNFSVGGFWLYAMVGPANEKHWARMNFLDIQNFKSIDIEDLFCDEEGNPNTQLPVSKGQNKFTETPNGTRVEFKMTYASEEDVTKMVEMGFEEGIILCFDQLEDMLKRSRV